MLIHVWSGQLKRTETTYALLKLEKWLNTLEYFSLLVHVVNQYKQMKSYCKVLPTFYAVVHYQTMYLCAKGTKTKRERFVFLTHSSKSEWPKESGL